MLRRDYGKDDLSVAGYQNRVVKCDVANRLLLYDQPQNFNLLAQNIRTLRYRGSKFGTVPYKPL